MTPVGPAPDRYYVIRDLDQDNFRAGWTADGRRVLMGLLCPDLVAVFFDAEGRLLGRERRPWSEPAPWWTGEGPFQVPDRREAIDRPLQEWQEEIGFEPGTISVRGFFLEEEYLGIKDLPHHLEEYLADPPGFLALMGEEADDYPGLIEDWEEAGQFVLWWGKDYWMEADGEVGST